jgi:hypothetical protein
MVENRSNAIIGRLMAFSVAQYVIDSTYVTKNG